MKTMYKVLGKGRISPYQNFVYAPNKEYTCENFDTDKTEDCSRGFYATELDGLCYAYRPGKSIYEVKVGGREVCINQFKHRFEKITVGRKLPISEVKKRIRSGTWDWNVEESLFPINPFSKNRKRVTNADIELLKAWASVRASVGASVWGSLWAYVGASLWDSVRDSVWASVGDSVWDSVRASVWASVGDSVRASVWASVWDSVGDSVWASVGASVGGSVGGSVWASVWASVGDSVGAYISSLFPNIQEWKHIDHKAGENPFQPCIDLWRSGLVPSFDGTTWRLNGESGILYELKKEDIV